MSQTRERKRFTISEVAADWHELMIPQRTMRPSIARVSGAESRHTITAPCITLSNLAGRPTDERTGVRTYFLPSVTKLYILCNVKLRLEVYLQTFTQLFTNPTDRQK